MTCGTDRFGDRRGPARTAHRSGHRLDQRPAGRRDRRFPRNAGPPVHRARAHRLR